MKSFRISTPGVRKRWRCCGGWRRGVLRRLCGVVGLGSLVFVVGGVGAVVYMGGVVGAAVYWCGVVAEVYVGGVGVLVH